MERGGSADINFSRHAKPAPYRILSDITPAPFVNDRGPFNVGQIIGQVLASAVPHVKVIFSGVPLTFVGSSNLTLASVK